MEITIDRLKAIYETSASARVLIKQWYPDLDLKAVSPSQRDSNGDLLVEGKWYVNNNNYLMKYYLDGHGVGFFCGSWSNNWSFGLVANSCIPATSNEILDKLLSMLRSTRNIGSSVTFDYNYDLDSIIYDGVLAYKNGEIYV